MIYGAEQAWKIHGLTQQAELWNVASTTPDHRIVLGALGPGELGRADLPCNLNGSQVCWLILNIWNSGTNWWTNADPNVPPGWTDARSVLVHEFGHWLGVGHSTDCPSSDAGPDTQNCPWSHGWSPSMHPTHGGGNHQRTIQQDDENALRLARPTAETNLLANGHVWEQSAHWGGVLNLGWQRMNGASTVNRVASGGTGGGGPAYINFHGVPNGSLYQDVFHIAGYANGPTMIPHLHVRSPNANTRVKVVVWNLRTGSPLYERNCALPNSWSWWSMYSSSYCSNGPDHDGNGNARTFRDPVTGGQEVLRFEVYNMTGTNLDIDYARLAF